MRRFTVTLALALVISGIAAQPALANAPIPAPKPWGAVILCIEGFRPLTHPAFSEWLDLRCVPDRP